MKKSILLFIFLISALGYSQAPEKMSYQAVIRGTDGVLIVNQSLGMQLSVLQGSPNGAAVYVETQNPTTNANGLATLEIGTGSVQQGDFASIDWANGIYYLKTETDLTGGNNYDITGTSQLLSTPYALYAKTSGSSIPGPEGPAGQDGEDGNGIESTVDNGDGTFTLNYTDGSSFTTIDLTGPEGPQGPAGSSEVTVIKDTDGDTQIQVEESPNENIIRFDLAGTEKWVMKDHALEQLNSGGSLFIGQAAGNHDDLSDNQNVYLGVGAGFSTNSGEKNVAVGYNTLALNTIGKSNTAVGHSALFNNNSSNFNSAFGAGAMYNNSSGNSNVAIGNGSLFSNTSGNNNNVMGSGALYLNTTGDDNIAIGSVALFTNSTGNKNLAIGNYALTNNTTGENNISIGFKSLRLNSFGDDNIALGNFSLEENEDGADNIAIGTNALQNNTEGNRNIAIGRDALFFNDIAPNNIAIGQDALKENLIGPGNIAIGYRALISNHEGASNIAIGESALANNGSSGSSKNIAIGGLALLNNKGKSNIGIGTDALKENVLGEFNVAIGTNANDSGSFTNTIVIGYNANATSDNEVRLGNSSISTIGGYANWTNVSDGRFKTNVKEDVVGLDFILKLRPVTYNLDMDAIARFNKTPDSLRLKKTEIEKQTEIQSGFIAQEVEAAAKFVKYDFHGVDIPKNEESFYGLRYAEFVVPLVKSVQELNQKLESKDEEIQNLQNQINELKAFILQKK